MSDTTDDYEPTKVTRREALRGGSAAAVAAGSYLLQQQLVQAASAQTTEPRINLGDDYALDDNPDGNGDLVITDLSTSTEVLRWDRSASEWTAGDYALSELSVSNVGARAYLGTDQAVASGTSTKIQIDTVVTDDQFGGTADFDTTNHKYVVPRDGWYFITAAMRYDNFPGGSGIAAQIRVNGSAEANATISQGADGNDLSYPISLQDRLSQGDEIELWTFQATGSNQTVLGGVANRTFLTVGRMG